MRMPYLPAHRRGPLLAAGLAAVAGLGLVALDGRVLARDDPGAEAPAKASPKRKRHVAPKPAPEETARAADAQDAPAAPPVAAAPVAAAPSAPSARAGAAAGAEKPSFDFAAQLDRAGASACRAQLNALATSTMASVESFNTVSSWSQGSGDRHPVSIAIGQRYAAGSAVPFGVSQVIATPNPQGSCDGLTVQVLPSPLPCAKVRDSIAARQGTQIGDLAGIPLMQEAGVNTMLVPTAADTCVLVATRTAYAR